MMMTGQALRLGRKSLFVGVSLLATAVAVTGAKPALAQVTPAQDPVTAVQDPATVAQDPATTTVAGEDNPEVIVVTAQKREQILLEIPQSVTVISRDTLERQDATSFQDYLALVPGLSLTGATPGITRVTLRGVNTGGVAATVSVYMDEVPFGSSTGLADGGVLTGDFDPFDVERIEVLRGPQGTLYGASSLSGVIKYVTTPPKLNKFEARGQVGIEDTSGGGTGYQTTGLVNLPVSDRLAIRVNGFYRKDAGFIDTIGNNSITSLLDGSVIARTLVDDNINDRTSYGGRVSALFQATDALSLRLTAFGQNLNSGASNIFEADPETLKPLNGRLTQSRFQQNDTKIKYRVYSGTVDWDVGFGNLVSSTSYSTFAEKFQSDATFFLGPLVNLLANFGPNVGLLGFPPSFIIAGTPVTRPLGVVSRQINSTDKFTQEVRLSSPDNDKFEWLVGGYFTKEKSAIDPQDFFAVEAGTNEIAGDVDQLIEVFLRSRYDEYAAFANATYHFTPRFDLTAGGRLSHNKQTADLLISGPLFPGGQEANDLNSSESVFTYTVAPRFEINDHTSVYARVATGYRPGGPNVIPIGSPAGTPRTYDSDTLTSYEVGFKGETPNRRLALEVAAFYLDWQDIQLFAVVNQTGINTNGGSARVKGLEAAATARPIRGLTLTANGAYTDAKLTEDTPPASGGLDGDRLPYVPKWSGAVNADYEWRLGADATGFVGGTLSFVGERPNFLGDRDEDGDIRRVPSYEQVDVRAGVNVGRWGLQAYARNLFNTRGITSASGFFPGANPNNAASIAIIRPRTIGLTLTAGL